MQRVQSDWASYPARSHAPSDCNWLRSCLAAKSETKRFLQTIPALNPSNLKPALESRFWYVFCNDVVNRLRCVWRHLWRLWGTLQNTFSLALPVSRPGSSISRETRGEKISIHFRKVRKPIVIFIYSTEFIFHFCTRLEHSKVAYSEKA